MMLQQSASDALLDGDIFRFVVETFTASTPEPILALLIFGSILGSIYMVQRSFVLPAIIVVLVGGVILSRVPLGVQQGVIASLVIAVAVIGYVIFERTTTN